MEWTDAGILYEGDQRHGQICIKQNGLEESTREVMKPVDRSVKDPRDANSLKMKEQESQPLSASAATMYRGMTARMNYLGQGRSETQSAMKELGEEMSNPNQGSWVKLKRLRIYLKSSPRYRWLYEYQGQCRNVVA